jgi:branched-chain amino acid transport system ATP-binding protein
MLSAKNLNAHYGQAHILYDVSLEASPGEVVVLLGLNGAGKSTTLKTLLGLVPPSGGEVVFRGERIDGLQPFQIVQRGLGYVPEDRRIFTDLTVLENLEVGRQDARPGVQGWTVGKLFELFPNLAEACDRPASQISGGEQQMLTIARTLMGNPACILLDEPSEGLAPVIVDQMAAVVREMKSEGLSVLLSEQNLHFASGVADRAYIIEKGRIRFTGTMSDLNADDSIRRAYLAV